MSIFLVFSSSISIDMKCSGRKRVVKALDKWSMYVVEHHDDLFSWKNTYSDYGHV
jgi:hypothetical protein